MKRLAILILWPSFVVAIAAEACFFAVFDPHEMQLGEHHFNCSPTAIYTLGFLGFWLFGSLTSALTCYLLKTPAELDPPF